jgi:hypothetical protein
MFNDDIDSSHAVAPPDLFALFICSAIIRNANLEKSVASLCYLRGNLRFKPKPVLINGNAVEALAPKDFITCFHVSEIQVRKHVREQCEKSVAYHMPEVDDAMRSAS